MPRFTSAHPGDFHRRRLVVICTMVALVLIASIAYAVLGRHNASPREQESGSSPDSIVWPARPATPSAKSPELWDISDPETFAREVSGALFLWDTSTLLTRADRFERLLAVADPTGESTIGLVSDLDNYLPAQEAWANLAKYETRQWLTIDRITTPTSWAQATAQAGDELLPGTTAYTIRGTRHRSGAWDGSPIETAHEVSFTVFLVCAPSYPTCHLLRLSLLDQPLD